MPSADFGLASAYYPPKAILEKGIVNKYHEKTTSDQYDDNINIHYTSYQLIDDSLQVNEYGAGFQLKSKRVYLFDDNIQRMISGVNYDFTQAEYPILIQQNAYKIWLEEYNDEILYYRQNMPTYSRELAITQDHTEDTTYLNERAKKFVSQYTNVVTRKSDTTTYKGENVFLYGLNKGKVHYRSKSERATTVGDLVEQMPMKTFLKRKSHGQHRIGYINPESILDKGTNFRPCTENQLDIHDYYNGSPPGNLKGKKGSKWSFIEQFLEPEKIAGQSGYLSIHFIINCKGEIGYFTVEQADLDYQPHQFSKVTIEHLMELTKKMHPWIPAKIWEENKDSYAYLIYKLKDGKIIEILP
ncbi:hypothetical protein N9B82_02130 [Saprospiraceae bacterium]|nr:hypothetical protein [Saprospiraceae bacterium]